MADVEPVAPPASGEVAALVTIQSTMGTPRVIEVARAMSHFGEHAQGWVAVSALGALAMPKRRRDWVLVGVGAVAAHAAAIAIKLVVRRARPNHPAVAVNVGTPSALSFPSAHATSTTAAAMLLSRATRSRLPLVVVPAMALSRLVLGVHYPTDVLAGAAVGAAVATTASRVAAPQKEKRK
ncbi:phosphatase PAP2 family protein [Mycolicibacterium aichiense]|uniref:Decaprenylphosphoryl-5-phosphoribose phosphatase n=1 Tax=Mycolicibacterium aichiense TaxID=1799 RepID=A0AAD1M9L0_9MYCO|nr:phosphatase PAP2 family protein [Mycolicibacterium aichiense]MCV7020836.1 phosphatase PAP2 family protein [Mycolicibacterium aichiense]BBX05403.1 putative decaprenylphosphoryl-5-phosphoribose phosphatase [Mycolicibacterium aichiense]STZ25245.1 conserved transmembrane protein [Mycolicibacterium aichiense]